MSAIIAYLMPEQFLFATDTFVHEKNDNGMRPVNFCSKVIYLPHLKTCVAFQGFGDTISQFFNFAQQKVIASNLYSLVLQTTKHFKVYLENSIEVSNLATLFLFGVNDQTDQLEVHKITITSKGNNKYEQLPYGLLHKPEIINFESFLTTFKDESPIQLLVNLMIEQKKQDALRVIQERAGIGGQVQITYLSYNKNNKDLIIQMQMVNAFNDFDDTYFNMLNSEDVE